MTAAEHQKILFGDKLTNLVPELDHLSDKIDEFFDSYAQQNLIKLSNSKTQLDPYEAAATKIFSRGKSSADVIQHFFEKINNDKKSVALSDETISLILDKMPPTGLNSFQEKHKERLDLTPRLQLSLTRFTESTGWNNKYKELLSSFRVEDFVEYSPVCLSLPVDFFSEKQYFKKPWGVSHSKETGVVLLLPNSHVKTRTPNLLQLCVAMHYFFEVRTCGEFLKHSDPSKTGQLLQQVMSPTHSKTLEFLNDRNAHDETWYWRQALSEVKKIIHLERDVNLHEHTINEDGLRSFHWVDELWNQNNINNINNHSYHLRQECWQALLQHLSTLDEEEFYRKIGEEIICDNFAFMADVIHT